MTKTDAELIAEVEGLDAKAAPDWKLGEEHETRRWIFSGNKMIAAVEVSGLIPCDSSNFDFIMAARTLLPELARRLKAANELLSPKPREPRPLSDEEKAEYGFGDEDD